jgi:hypothetical protein
MTKLQLNLAILFGSKVFLWGAMEQMIAAVLDALAATSRVMGTDTTV